MDQRLSPRDAIVQAAVDVGLSGGAAALTARSVGGAAGLSAAAVIYHFGSRDRLLQSVFERVADDFAALRRAEEARLVALATLVSSTAAAVSVAISGLCEASRPHRLLLEELTEAAICGAVELGQAPQLERTRTYDFWDRLVARWEPAPDRRRLWTGFAMGASWLLLAEMDPAIARGWVFQLAERLARRLDRAPQGSTAAFEQDEDLRLEVAFPRKQRFVDAAIRAVGRGGAGQLTLRKIAAEAGASLGATARAFDGRVDILLSIHEELRRRVLQRGTTIEGPLESAVSLSHFDEAGAPRVELSALRALHGLACREPELAGTASELLKFRARDGVEWLRLHGVGHADLTDGWIWLTLVLATLSEALLLEPPLRQSLADERTRSIHRLLFAG